MRSLLIIISDFGQAVWHATRSGGDQQAGGRRDARRLHRSAICAGVGGGRTRCAPTAMRGAHADAGRTCNEAERIAGDYAADYDAESARKPENLYIVRIVG